MKLQGKQYKLFKLFEYQRLYDIFVEHSAYYSTGPGWPVYLSIIKDIIETDRLETNLDSVFIRDRYEELSNMFDFDKEMTLDFIRRVYSEFYLEIAGTTFSDALVKLKQSIDELEVI